MKNELTVFEHELFGSVRTLKVNDKPYFVGVDVATALGYSNGSKAVLTHCKNGIKEIIDVSSQNGNAHKARNTQTMVLIPEGDVYRLIVKSKLPAAERFESWVFDQVLPQIRQTGGYIPVKEDMSDEEFLAKALMIAQNTLAKKDQLIKSQQETLMLQQPKVEYHDNVLNVEGLLTTTTIAKDLGISARRLNSLLHELGYIYKQGNVWHLYAKHQGLVPEYCDYHTSFDGFTTLKWTQKGRQMIIDVYNDHIKELV